jgi:hypothetical protein
MMKQVAALKVCKALMNRCGSTTDDKINEILKIPDLFRAPL